MTYERLPTAVGTVLINSLPYKLIRGEEGQQFQSTFIGEPPWLNEAPPMVSDPAYTWHVGGLKSRQGVPGTSEYGINTDARWPLKLLPGPRLNTYNLPGTTSPVTYVFSGLGYIWALAGTRLYRIAFSNGAVTLSRNFGLTLVHGIEWQGTVYVTQTDGTLSKLNSIGAPDSWSDGSEALYLAKGFNRLFKIYNNADGTLTAKNIVLGLDPLQEANWADEVIAPGQATDLVAYDRTIIINAGTLNGLYTVGEEGFGIPQARRILPTGRMRFIEPYVYIPHLSGTARFVPGFVDSIGLENEIMNESPVIGTCTGITADGHWLYMSIYDGVHTYILHGHERASMPGFGPILWDTLFRVDDTRVQAFDFIYTDNDKGLLVYTKGNDLGYVILPNTGGPPVVSSPNYFFSLSGQRFTYRYSFDDRGIKNFPQIRISGKNLTSQTYWEIAYSIDGGAFINVDIDGAIMRLTDNDLHTFLLSRQAVGTEIQYRFTYTGLSDTVPGRIDYFEPYAIPRAHQIETITFNLLIDDNTQLDDMYDSRSMEQVKADLDALLESPSTVKLIGPWSSDELDALVTRVDRLRGIYNDSFSQSQILQVSCQIRKQ